MKVKAGPTAAVEGRAATGRRPASSCAKVGIVGLGRSGWGIHAQALEGLPDHFEVIAAADAGADRRQEAAARFGCRTYTDITSLVRDPEVELVVIATPSHLHADQAILAMEAGKHVLCEKPMTTSLAEADRMIAVAHRTGRSLSVFHNRRFDPHFLKVSEIIDSGVLGRIVQIRLAVHSFARRWDWQTLREFGGGTLNNAGPHFLDQLMSFFPHEDPSVFCHMDTALTFGDAEDHCVVMLRAVDAPLVQMEITSACAMPDDNWLVMGTQGTLRGTFARLHWRIADFSTLPARTVDRAPTPDRSYNSEKIRWQEGNWEVPQAQATTAWTHRCYYESLYQSLREGAPLAVSATQVRRQIRVLDACRAFRATARSQHTPIVTARPDAAINV